MSNFDDNYPQTMHMDEEIKKKYFEKLVTLEGGLFYKRELTELYLISASLGLKNKLRLKTKKSTDLRLYQTLNDKGKLLIRIIVLASTNYDFDILKNGHDTLKIVEEYANAGAAILYDKITQSKLSFSIEDELWDSLKKSLDKDK